MRAKRLHLRRHISLDWIGLGREPFKVVKGDRTGRLSSGPILRLRGFMGSHVIPMVVGIAKLVSREWEWFDGNEMA